MVHINRRGFRLIVGSLFLFGVSTLSALAQSQCCALPTAEATSVASTYGTVYTEFNMAISNGSGTSFDLRYTEEAIGVTGSNSCYVSGGTLPQNPTISGGEWEVGGGDPYGIDAIQGPPTHNTWGYDVVGVSTAVISQIRTYATQGKITLPCTITLYQNMDITCLGTGSGGTLTQYEANNVLSIQVYSNRIVNSRRGVAQTISY